MPVRNQAMTVSDLSDTLGTMDGTGDLEVRIANYEGDHGMRVYSVRRHQITDEEGAITEDYIVING